MRIVFVGVHHKRGLKPLDSKSASGKRLDAAIARLPFPCLKTNLFDTDYLPLDPDEKEELKRLWLQRYEVDGKTVVVLLGGTVHKEFPKGVPCRAVVHLPHPSPLHSKRSTEEYADLVVERILEYAKESGD